MAPDLHISEGYTTPISPMKAPLSRTGEGQVTCMEGGQSSPYYQFSKGEKIKRGLSTGVSVMDSSSYIY